MLNIRKFLEGIGIVPKSSSTADTQGELEVLSSDGKLRYHNGTSVSPVVTEAHSATLTNKTIDADSNTITNIENADIKAGAAIDASKIADGSVSSTEFQYLANVTSDIQTQLNSKSSATLNQDHILVGNASNVATGVDTTAVGDIEADTTNGLTIKTGAIVNADINASAAIDASKIADGSVSNAEFQYLANVTSDIQTQLNNAVTASSTNTLTNKTIDGDNNTVQDLALTSLKTNLTDANKFLVRDGSGIVVSNTKDVPTGAVVGTTDTQTLTNKTLTNPTVDTLNLDDQASTPSNPSAGFYKVYVKSDGKAYILNSSGVETQIGSGGLGSSTPSSIKTSDYAVLVSDKGKTIPVDTTSGQVVITLPDVSNTDFIVTIKDVSGTANTNNIIIETTNVADLIDNAAGYDKINTRFTAYSYISNGTRWIRLASFAGNEVTGVGRGLFAGGYAPGTSNVIDYVTISTTGNATDFGDLNAATGDLAACSSLSRALFAGGNLYTNVIDYVTIATTGNATDFGDLTVARRGLAGCSNSTRGLFGGGFNGSLQNVIDYVTIATTGNATDFGDLSVTREGTASFASTTRGIWAGGETPTVSNVIDYVTIATTGNATDFGDLTVARRSTTGASNSTTGLIIGGADGGGTPYNTVDYITIATTGNATDFGDLTTATRGMASCSNSTRVLAAGGNTGSYTNTIEYFTIASPGNATDFGDLTVARGFFAGCSDSHGGI